MKRFALVALLLCSLSAWAAPPSVDITWAPSVSVGVTAQNIYRAVSTSGVCGSYAIIKTFNDNTTAAYSDLAVINGTVYCYKLTAMKGSSESPFSNIISLGPDEPAAPQNVQGLAH